MVIRGAWISEVVFGDIEPRPGDVVDVSGKTVLPGLIDLHVHSLAASGPFGYVDDDPLVEDHLKAMLRSGVTSYLDLGSSRRVIFEYRARIDAGALLSPRLFAVGPLLTPTGGHPCYSGSPPGDFCIFIDSPSDAGPAVQALLPHTPDFIKVVLDGGAWPSLPRMTGAAVAAVGQAAESAGLRVIAHVASLDDIEDALDAGVTHFAHLPLGERLTPELARRMAEAGAVVVPTLSVIDSLYRIAHGALSELDDPAIGDDVPSSVLSALRASPWAEEVTSPSYRALAAAWRANMLASLEICRQAGVTIAGGTDAGNPGTFHGLSMARELALYVEAGMPPFEALNAATRTAADVLRRPDLGRIEEGALADLLVVDGDPLADIRALGRVSRVYRSGVLIDRDALALPRKTSLAQAPTVEVEAGGTCLGASECGAALECRFDQVCAARCGSPSECSPGSACLSPGGDGAPGLCFEGDGCDLLAQDCQNGAACVFLGNGATACWYAGTGRDGQPCDEYGACAAGSMCDERSGTCEDLCDPDETGARRCPSGKRCVDRSAAAGVRVGACE